MIKLTIKPDSKSFNIENNRSTSLFQVSFLISHSSILDSLQASLRGLPDLERQLARVCSLGMALKERKAVIYADVISKQLEDFFRLLDSFDNCSTLIKQVGEVVQEIVLGLSLIHI